MAAALGIVPHTGWAWLVSVGGTVAKPRIERRERIVVCDVVDGQLYHLAAEQPDDPASFLATRRAATVIHTREALHPHVGAARAAVVLGKHVVLPALDRILSAHPLIHTAEGELWRAIFADACAFPGVAVTRSEALAVRSALDTRIGGVAVVGFLADSRRIVGAPWTRELQDAALAAWSALGPR